VGGRGDDRDARLAELQMPARPAAPSARGSNTARGTAGRAGARGVRARRGACEVRPPPLGGAGDAWAGLRDRRTAFAPLSSRWGARQGLDSARTQRSALQGTLGRPRSLLPPEASW
jgi:hypothetical protein